MGVLEWLTGSRDSDRTGTGRWRAQWAAAAAQPSTDQIRSLDAALRQLGLPEEEVEVEREMLDALERVTALAAQTAAHGLPL